MRFLPQRFYHLKKFTLDVVWYFVQAVLFLSFFLKILKKYHKSIPNFCAANEENITRWGELIKKILFTTK